MEIIAFKNMVWDLTRQISDGMDELFRPISAHYGLTHMQLRILLELWAGVANNRQPWTCAGSDQREYVLYV